MEANVKVSKGTKRDTSSGTKSVKAAHRHSKRASQTQRCSKHGHTPLSPHAVKVDRNRRVWKACERCRRKKIKCNGGFPCKRCKDNDLVCTAGTRKKTEFKKLPRGYAEVLENMQIALISAIHKLYAMVRNEQQWELGEPELNDRGQPITHDIVTMLGCIRPNVDADLPPHTVFPEDENDLSKLAAELEIHQDSQMAGGNTESESSYNRTERAGSSEIDDIYHLDSEQDDEKIIINNRSMPIFSPQSFTPYKDFNANTILTELDPSTIFPIQLASNSATLPPWSMARPPSAGEISSQWTQQMDLNMVDIMLSQGLIESESGFGAIKPDLSLDVLLGVGDTVIHA